MKEIDKLNDIIDLDKAIVTKGLYPVYIGFKHDANPLAWAELKMHEGGVKYNLVNGFARVKVIKEMGFSMTASFIEYKEKTEIISLSLVPNK